MTNPVDIYTAHADHFKLLGHPVRLQILDALRRSPECVCHLEVALERPQPYISQQLRVLRESGVVADRKDGLNVYYHLVDPQTATLLNAALGPVLPATRGQREKLPDCTCPKCAPPQVAEITLLEG